MMEAVFVDVPDGRICTWQMGQGEPLLFAHATGMCGLIYAELLEPLVDRFRIIVPDARGHGRTTLPAAPEALQDDWVDYRQDMLALLRALNLGPVHLVGHSLGGTVMLHTAADHPQWAKSLFMIDAAFVAFDEAPLWQEQRANGNQPPLPIAQIVARRRNVFASAEEAFASWHQRGVFKGWPDQTLEAYIQGGMIPEGDTLRLACHPEWEAATFNTISTRAQDAINALEVPLIFLVAGEGGMFCTKDIQRIRALKPNALIDIIPQTPHFLPVTHPHLVAPYFSRLGD